MTIAPHDTPMLLTLGFCLAAGIAVGVLYFGGLWWNVRLFADRRHAGVNVLLMLGRIAGLGGALTFAARQGAMPLLLTALGVFIARFAVMRHVRATPS